MTISIMFHLTEFFFLVISKKKLSEMKLICKIPTAIVHSSIILKWEEIHYYNDTSLFDLYYMQIFL